VRVVMSMMSSLSGSESAMGVFAGCPLPLGSFAELP
jgi:hypothetical protein